jgi:hypothetical protein
MDDEKGDGAKMKQSKFEGSYLQLANKKQGKTKKIK